MRHCLRASLIERCCMVLGSSCSYPRSSAVRSASSTGRSGSQSHPFSLLDVMGDDGHDGTAAHEPESATRAPQRLHTAPAWTASLTSSAAAVSSGDTAHASATTRTAPREEPRRRSPSASTSFSSTPRARGASEKGDAAVRAAVQDAVLTPLSSGDSHSSGVDGDTSGSNSKANAPELRPVSARMAVPIDARVFDRYGMPADLPSGSPRDLGELAELSPQVLRDQLAAFTEHRRWTELTTVQAAVIPLVLEYRDVLCIAPTATGKTFSYLYPAVLRLLLDDLNGGARTTDGGDADVEDGAAGVGAGGTPAFTRRQVETQLQEQISRGEVCRYCELSVAQTPICPMTGVPHPPPPLSLDGSALPLNARQRQAMRLEELSRVAEPRLLILVPTSQLAFQVYNTSRRLHGDYEVRYMVRAANAEEQRKFLHALEGVDILISTPETILPALLKQKLSLKRVKTLVVDEVDDVLSVNHFEKLKMVLGAMPKGANRPQRLLFGASLPSSVYQMIREKMLQPSHRFVLADTRKDALGHPVLPSRSTSFSSPLAPSSAVAGDGDSPVGAQGREDPHGRGGPLLTGNCAVTHVVFLLGRVEKMQKLAWLYATGRLTFDQRAIVFCSSRHNVAYVHDQLSSLVPELKVLTLTSHTSSTAREGVLRMFTSGVASCLVCTDLLSRGIDFRGVVYVVHYDMPTEMEVWVNRNGRCARHGLPGYAYTFFQPENLKLAKPLVAYLRQHRQLVPPKLQEYARQPFIDAFRRSQLLHATRPYRRDDPQNTTPVLGRGTARFPDYRQEGIRKHFRPL